MAKKRIDSEIESERKEFLRTQKQIDLEREEFLSRAEAFIRYYQESPDRMQPNASYIAAFREMFDKERVIYYGKQEKKAWEISSQLSRLCKRAQGAQNDRI